MKKRTLGRTGLPVSRLCLGTTSFGWRTNQATSFALLDAFYAAGGNLVQTCGDSFGTDHGPACLGLSEEFVGRWMRARRVPRREMVIAARVALRRPLVGGAATFGAMVRRGCEASLRRLQTPYLDLLLFEWSPSLVPLDDLLQAFDALFASGCVRYPAVADFPLWRTMDAIGRANTWNYRRLAAVEAEYSLLQREAAESGALELCAEHRLGFFAHSPLAKGVLVGGNGRRPRRRVAPGAEGDPRVAARQTTIVAELGVIAHHRQAPPAQVALAWVLANPRVTACVVGANSVAHLRELIDAIDVEFTPAELERLNEISSLPACGWRPPGKTSDLNAGHNAHAGAHLRDLD